MKAPMIVVWAFSFILLPYLAIQHASGQSNEPREAYHFNTLGLGPDGDGDYVDLHPGSDMLPYTDDDIVLPERGNIGGTWGAAHFDLDSDGVVDEEEHIFSVIRRDDDDAFTYSSLSHPEYGVIYESEDWVDYHEARNQGPSKCCPGDPGAEGNDFEHNDRRAWEGESNAYPYNNIQANQHGRGKPRYYFDNINPANPLAASEPYIFDEVEGFTKALSFQNNMDDPGTPFNERGTCRNDYMRSPNAITRGYLIPVEDLASLETGSLPSLFNWEPEGFDIAAYLRDTIEPLLQAPQLTLFHQDLGSNPDFTLPITHLMLFQIECPIDINIGNTCQDQFAAESMAAYWGLEGDGAIYRVSHIMGYNQGATETIFGDTVRPWKQEPDDGEARNLWLLDHFFRNNPSHLGRYTFLPQGTMWTIINDPGFGIIDQSNNKVLSADIPGAVLAMLPKPLETGEVPIEFVVDVATAEPDWVVHLVLLAEGEVKVYAEISEDDSLVNLGGEMDNNGIVSGGVGVDGPGTTFGNAQDGEYSRYVLKASSDNVALLELAPDEVQPNNFSGLNNTVMEELVFLQVEESSALAGIDQIAVAMSGPGVISTLALLAAPASLPDQEITYRRGDGNDDGDVNISDAQFLLNFLFLGGPELACIAAGDANNDDQVNISDAQYILNFLFLGGPDIEAPFPDCGPLPEGATLVCGESSCE